MEYREFYNSGIHILLEKLDTKMDFESINQWMTDTGTLKAPYPSPERRRQFLEYHIKMTEPCCGQWNWSKQK